MIGIEVAAPDKLDLVARVLRDLGDKDLRRELYAGLNRATKEVRAEAKAEAGRRLPQRGGLARTVSGARLSTRRVGGRNPGVRVVAKGLNQLSLLDKGAVIHPVFGNRDVWVTQKITGGWFSDPMEGSRDEIAREIDGMLDDVAAKAVRRLGLAA